MTDIAFKSGMASANRGEFVTAAARKKEVLAFRSTHFIMGKHPTTHYSQAAHSTRVREGLQGGRQDKQGSAAQTNGTNFNIGTGRNRNQYATTYNTITGQAPLHQASRVTLDDVAAKKTNIMLGKPYRSSFVTTNNRVYEPKSHGSQAIDKNFVYDIKTNHFEYGDTRRQSFAQIR